MTLIDYLAAAAGAWLILACVSGTGWALIAAHHKRRARRTVVAEPRDWYCTDGLWRTEAEAAAWVAETDGSLAEWLAVWPTVEEPLYVPSEWVA